jgi:hypothetical protein
VSEDISAGEDTFAEGIVANAVAVDRTVVEASVAFADAEASPIS